MFTEEEVKAAKATRDEIIRDDIEVLKGIYMAGEICMWDEMHKENILLSEFSNQAAEDMKEAQDILWEEVEDEINGVCNEYSSNSEVTMLMNTLKSKFIISKK